MLLHTLHPTPVLVHLGAFTVRWYGLLLALAATAGLLLFRRLTRGSLSDEHRASLAVGLVVFGFIGARLYHVLNEPAYYAHHLLEIPAVWNGGLAIHGALLAGAITAWVWAKRNHIGVLGLLDALAPGVALGQAIGRWGNFFNQELFGRPTDLPWGIPIDPMNRPAGYEGTANFHPTFLYESIGDLCILGILLLLRTRWRARRDGDLVLVYLALTSVVRAATEFLRIDRVPIVAGIRLPLIVALALALTATTLLLIRHARPAPAH